MILSRVIEHVKKQHWTAIVIDFVIVVMGVFVGMQAQEWNASRHDREREASYLIRIRTDIQADIEALAERRRYWASIAAAGRAAAEYAETGALIDGSAWKTVRSFFWASNVWIYAPNDTAFKEMSTAGDVTLIRNGSLRAALSSYYSDSTRLTRAVVYTAVPDYRQAIRGATPVSIARYVIDKCHSHGPLNQHFIECPAPVSEAAASKILQAYLGRPLLVDRLRSWVTNLEQLDQGAEPDDAAARRLKAALDDEIERR